MNTPEEALKRLTPEAAWRPYAPTVTNPWNEEKVAHLLRRSCFGASWSEIQDGVKQSPGQLVDRVVAG